MRYVALVLLAACGAPARPPATQPASRPADPRASADDLRAAVLDSYLQLSQGYEGLYLDGLLHDPRLVLIDVEADDVLVGYDAQRALAMRRIFPDVDQEVISKDLHVHLSDDGGFAWTDDHVSYRVLAGGRRAILPERATAVYERREGRWLQVAGHVSYPVPEDQLFAPRAEGKLPSAIATGVFAEDVRQLVLGLCADRGEARRAVATDDEAVLIGPDATLRGKDIAARPTPRAQFGPSATIDPIAVRVNASTTGTVAWAAALLHVTDPRGTTTARATWVIVARGGGLAVVQSHISLAVDAGALAASLFPR